MQEIKPTRQFLDFWDIGDLIVTHDDPVIDKAYSMPFIFIHGVDGKYYLAMPSEVPKYIREMFEEYYRRRISNEKINPKQLSIPFDE